VNEHLLDLLDRLPGYLGGHMLLSLASLLVGLVISVPLGILASRRPRLGELTLGLAGVIQTVPSLALLALMVLLLRGQIGFVPAFLALTLYSVLPILANTVVGIRGVDPALVEAARGLGMSDRQLLYRVQLPLAAPVIIGGIRTATVLVIGTATLVTPVGGTSLGNYIFSGLESLNHAATIFGCVFAAVLAVVLDQLIRLLEVSARKRNRRLAWTAATCLLLVLLGGLYEPIQRLVASGTRRAAVASGPFTEQHILNEVLMRRLAQEGFRADSRPGMSEGIQFQALFHDQVDCIVNYTGNVWTLLMHQKECTDRATTTREVKRFLREEHGVECLGSLGFENAYAFALRKDVADELGVHSLTDLHRLIDQRASRGKRLLIGGDNQFFDRPEWRQVKGRYQLDEKHIRTIAMDPTLMYRAVRDGEVDVIVGYTSDQRIPAYNLVVLGDPREAIPPYDAVLLLSPAASRRPELVSALRTLVDRVQLDAMRQANARVDEEKWTARRAAAELLARVQGHSEGG
jgi:osmoprotectant transport system permease protein